MVGIHSKHYGKGPTKAKTYLIEDVVMTVMQDVFTTVERTLIDHGKGELIREVRSAFQYTLRPEFMRAIHELTGRDVAAFISQVDYEADMAVEVFLLADGVGAANEVTDVTQDGGGAT